MQNYDSEDYYSRTREKRKKKWIRRQKIKRAVIIAVLVLIVLAVLVLLFFGAKGLITYLKTEKEVKSEFIEDNSLTKYALVDNTDRPIEIVAEVTEVSDEDTSAENGSTPTETIPTVKHEGLIIVDAGHGGEDSGAFSDIAYEKNVNLDIAYWLKEELESRGYTVFMTRTDDTYVGLQARANLANEQKGALAMVSIHQNSIDEFAETVSGIEAWTYERSGCIELAHLLADKVSEATGARNRGVDYKTNLVVTSKTTMPSVIIECGYISNTEEAKMLIQEEYQIKIAKGIANAIDEFIDTYY